MRLFIPVALFTLVLGSTGFSQSTVYLKAFQNTDLMKRTEKLVYQPVGADQETDYSLSRFSRISFGVGVVASKLWNHDMEISYSRTLPPIEHVSAISHQSSDVSRHFFSIQYDLSMRTIMKKNVHFQSGIGITPYIASEDYRSGSSVEFPITESNVGSTISTSLRLVYRLSSMFNVELSGRAGALNVNQYTSRIGNPQVPVEEREIANETKWRVLPSIYSFGLGISYKIK